MFIESFKLKKDGWHMKLMNFIWGVTYKDFSHICPYWWSTLATVVFIVPLLAWTFLKKGIIYLAEKADDMVRASRDRKWERRQKEIDEFYEKIKSKDFFDKIVNSCDSKFKKFKDQMWDYNFSNKFDSHNEYYEFRNRFFDEREKIEEQRKEKERTQEQLDRERQIKRKQTITKVLNVVKPILKVLFVIASITAAIFVVYYAYIFISWLITLDYSWAEFWKWDWVDIMATMLSTILYIGGLALFIYLFVKAIRFANKSSKTWCTPKWVKSIERGLIWFGTGVVTIWNIIVQMIKDNCPSIDWE